MSLGKTTGLYGASGSGKTTQIGQYAKYIKKLYGKRTRYVGADLGGNDSISPLVRAGIMEEVYFGEKDDPWAWINHEVSTMPADDIGLIAYDSGTSMGEALLSSAAKLGAQGLKVGSQPAQKFNIPGTMMNIGSNTESHYMVVQNFLLDAIWKSTWLARKGVDVIWTFSEHKAENPIESSIVGPKLAGKALTGSIPKWLRYTLRLVTVPVQDGAARHLLMTQEQPELNGLGMSFANARYPLEALTPLPPIIEPASIITFWECLEKGQKEADEVIRLEMGL